METKVARRYAQSLMDLAMERNIAGRINDDMLLISNTVKENRELLLMLRNPIITSDKKAAVIRALFKDKTNEVTALFLEIIISKGREKYLGDIADSYVHLFKDLNGIKTAYVTTAFPMDAEMRAEVMGLLKRAKGEKVELVEKVDESLIGGFVLRIGDVQFDTSLSRKLKGLKSGFDKNLYIKDY